MARKNQRTARPDLALLLLAINRRQMGSDLRDMTEYSRKDFLIIAVWWGLVTGFMVGLRSFNSHPWTWRDLMRAELLFDPLLFVIIGMVVIALRRSLITHSLMVRGTIGYTFLAAYAFLNGLLPTPHKLPLPFLVSLLVAGLGALVFHFYRTKAAVFQRRTLPLLVAVAFVCAIMFPLRQRSREARELAQTPVSAPGIRNVMLVVIDTLRADHLSLYGYSRPTTPNLARIAAQGIRFDNAISASSWTLPSHASILTGLYPHDHHTDGELNLSPEYPTLAEVLRNQGFRTAAFSGNAGTFSRDRGFGRGFIHFEDSFESLGSSFGQTFYGWKLEARLCELGLMRDLLGRPTAADVDSHALRWIDQDQRPFFVVVNYYDVHDPYVPPEGYDHLYTTAKRAGGHFTEHWQYYENLTAQQRQAALDAYDGAINYVDAQLGRLMRELDKRNLTQNTLVIITSDHGEGFDEHGLMNHGNSLYRELIHVPLVLFAPGLLPKGIGVAEPVSTTALAPTVLDLLGNQVRSPFPMASLKTLWGKSTKPVPAPISEVAQLPWNAKFPNYYGPMQSIVTSKWHYITGGNTGEQLFHCCDEPLDSPNLAATIEGQKLCGEFRRELELATKVNPEGRQSPAGLTADRSASNIAPAKSSF